MLNKVSYYLAKLLMVMAFSFSQMSASLYLGDASEISELSCLETVDGISPPLLGVLPFLALKEEWQSCLPDPNWQPNPPADLISQGPADTPVALWHGEGPVCIDWLLLNS